MYHKKNIYDNDLSGCEKHFLLLKVEDGLRREFAVELPMPQMFEQEVSLWCLIGVSDVIIFFCSQPKCSLKICMVMNRYSVPC